MWDNDNLRYKTLLEEYNIKTIIIWETDYRKGLDIKRILGDNGILF